MLAALAAYQNSLDVPFVFDDTRSIAQNETIRHLWPLSGPLSPPLTGEGVGGRPLVNLSLALNYALGNLDVHGYHLMNLALHALAGLALWGVLRRTLRQPVLPSRLRENAEPAAWTMALLWLVHPLQTETVVCVIQRTEIMGGLFFLLALYAFIRSTEGAGPSCSGALRAPGLTETAVIDRRYSLRWAAASVTACLLGVASKEIVATLPLLALLYDRTFVSGTFRAAWARRRGLYLALAATWLLVGWLMLLNPQRGGTVGFGLGVSAWEYLLTQCQALTIYLKLSLWPHPLVVDYGTVLVKSPGEVWGRGLFILALLAGTIVALRRRPVLGFLGAWFFVILAPSSSIVPLTTQTIAEHRMYLPLVAVLGLVVGAGFQWLGRAAWLGLIWLAAGAGWMTAQRNEVYQDDLTLWLDTVEHSPANSRALSGLGTAYFSRDKLPEAKRCYLESLRLDPGSAMKQFNVGLVLERTNEPKAAVPYYREALRLTPPYGPAHARLAALLIMQGAGEEALPHLRAAIAARPNDAFLHYSLGHVLAGLGRKAEAAQAYTEAIRLEPSNGAARQELEQLHANP